MTLSCSKRFLNESHLPRFFVGISWPTTIMLGDKLHSVGGPVLCNHKMGECHVNLKAKCRLCLAQEDIVLYSLLTGEVPRRYEYPQTVRNKIWKLFNINVCADSLPDKICHNCLINVDMFFAFNEIVEAGQYKLKIIAEHRDKVKRSVQAKEANKDGAKDNIMDEPLVPFRTFKKLSRIDPLAVSKEALPPSWTDNSLEKKEDPVRHKVKLGKSIIVKPCPLLQPAAQLLDKLQSESPNIVNMCIQPYMTPLQTKKATMILKPVTNKYEDFQKLPKVSACVMSDGPLKDQHSMTAPPVLQSTSGSRNVSPVTTSTSMDSSIPQGTPKVTIVDISKIVEGTRDPLFSVEKGLECEVCSKLCKHKTMLLRHILGHYKDNIYTCHHLDKDCQNKVWFSSTEFKEHLETVHRDKQSFVLTALSPHLKKPAKAVICKICMVTVDSKASLEEHRRKVHKDYYQCQVCKNWFSTKSNLISHFKSHKLVA